MSIRHAMLALLSEGPKYGLQLREEFEERTGEVWPLNVGQVYTTLARLERDGLIAPASAQGARDSQEMDEGPQKAYRITDEGQAELDRWLRTPPDLSTPPRDELVMKILISLRVPNSFTRDVIQIHRRCLVELMQEWTHVKEDAAEDDLSVLLAVDAELFRLDAVVRWLDAAEARIRRTAANQTSEHPETERTEGREEHEPKSTAMSGLTSEAALAERGGNSSREERPAASAGKEDKK
jgi:DNA-binding PadR family transcriptional regulator